MFSPLAFVLEFLSAVRLHVAADAFVNRLRQAAAAKRIEVRDLNDGSDYGQRATAGRYRHMTHPGAVAQRYQYRPLAFRMMASDNDGSRRGELPLQRRIPGMGPPGRIGRAVVFEDDAFGPALPQQLQCILLLPFRACRLDKEKRVYAETGKSGEVRAPQNGCSRYPMTPSTVIVQCETQQ